MTKTFSRVGRWMTRLAIGGVLVASYYAVFVAPVASGASAEDGAKQWAAGLTQVAFERELPRAIWMPKEYRDALVQRATPELLAKSWRAAVESIKEEWKADGALTPAQEAVLVSFEARLTPQLLDHSSESQLGLVDLERTIISAFGRDRASKLLATSAGGDSSYLPLRERIAYTLRTSASPAAKVLSFSWVSAQLSARGFPNCSCSMESNWCGGNNQCDLRSGGCWVQQQDCGTLLQYDCDGLCYPPVD